MNKSSSKPRIFTKAQTAQDVLPFISQPEHALPLLGMLAQAQLSIEDLLGQISKGSLEKLLVLSAQQVAGAKHPGRHSSDVRLHGTQAGQVGLSKAKLKVQRPRLRDGRGELDIPAFKALHADERLFQRMTDILTAASAPVNTNVRCTAATASLASPKVLSAVNTSRSLPGHWRPCARGALTSWTWWPCSWMV